VKIRWPCSPGWWPASRRCRGDARAVLEGHATATDLADYLVRKGMPFRDAHEVVAARCAKPRSRARPCRAAARKLAPLLPSIGADVKRVLNARRLGRGAPPSRRHRPAESGKRWRAPASACRDDGQTCADADRKYPVLRKLGEGGTPRSTSATTLQYARRRDQGSFPSNSMIR